MFTDHDKSNAQVCVKGGIAQKLCYTAQYVDTCILCLVTRSTICLRVGSWAVWQWCSRQLWWKRKGCPVSHTTGSQLLQWSTLCRRHRKPSLEKSEFISDLGGFGIAHCDIFWYRLTFARIPWVPLLVLVAKVTTKKAETWAQTKK